MSKDSGEKVGRLLIIWMVLIVLFGVTTITAAASREETVLVGAVTPTRASELVVGGIECTGNLTTNCELIQREFYLKSGERLNEDEVENARIRLLITGLFRDVIISLKKGEQRGQVILVVDVKEVSPYFTESRVTFATNPNISNWTLSVKGGHRNLMGYGKILSAELSNWTNTKDSYSRSAKIEYEDPHLGGSKRFFGSLRTIFQNERYIDSGSEVVTLGTTAGARIFDFSFASLEYSNRKYYKDLTDFDFQTLSLNYGWNSENDPYMPTDGSKAKITTSKLWYRRGDTYQKPFEHYGFDARKHVSFSARHVVSADVYGFVSSDKSWLDRWYLTPGVTYSYDIARGREADLRDSRVSMGVAYAGSYNRLIRGLHFNKITEPILTTGLQFYSNTVGLVQLSVFTDFARRR